MAIRLKTLNTNGLETEINGAEIEGRIFQIIEKFDKSMRN